MQFLAKNYLIGFCLIFAQLGQAVAQENRFSFTWLDESEHKLAGALTANLNSQPGDGLYQLGFSVTWLDPDGKPMLDVNRMPVLCLSKYDLDIVPDQNIRISVFEQKTPFSLVFPVSGTLNMQVLNGYSGKITLTAHFQYAFSRASYEEGKSYLIDYKGSNAIRMEFQVKSGSAARETDLARDSRLQASGSTIATAMRAISGQYEKSRQTLQEIEKRQPEKETERPDYLRDLDLLADRIETERSRLNPDSIPPDSFAAYRERYSRLNYKVIDLREAFMNLRIAKSSEIAGADSAVGLRNIDSLRILVRLRYEPILRTQEDTLDQLMNEQGQIAQAINSLTADSKDKRFTRPRADSLVMNHRLLEQAFLELQSLHEKTWNNYRLDINGFPPVPEIDNLHTSFVNNQTSLQSAIDRLNGTLASSGLDQKNTPWYLSVKFIWIALIALFILAVTLTVLSSVRNRRILKAQLTTREPGAGGTTSLTGQAGGIFTGEVPEEYYITDYRETIPEALVGTVNYHSSAIKSVFQAVQGALLERKGNDFGGYLFGNQYKLPGNGPARMELFIEKVCHSKYLRPTITNDSGARADLVDELDELVRQNKKYSLIGWFTSSLDSSMEIPEGLMKIHRSFFKDKWQIGILLNPASDLIQGAGFLRRRSGFLDPMPDPASFIRWDDLYRFALNPAAAIRNESGLPAREDEDYSRIALNNTWGDSIITAVNFDLQVLAEISAAAAQQAIPKDTYQVVGYLYGKVVARPQAVGKQVEYEVYVDRFIELANELTPRDLPGMALLGWWGQSNVDIINYLQAAIDYHEGVFRETHQFACLVNPNSGELRVFTRKHSLVMNNSTIETEEYQLKSLLSR